MNGQSVTTGSRDNKNSKAQLPSLLRVPWTISVDPETLYAQAQDRYAKEILGATIAECVTSHSFHPLFPLPSHPTIPLSKHPTLTLLLL